MKKAFAKLIKRLHRHQYTKPICSKYYTFHQREIIYECKCGERKSFIIWRAFGESFPIETTLLITDKEFQKILHNNK